MTKLGFAAQLADDLSPDDLRLVLTVFQTDVTRLTGALADAARLDDDTAFRRAAHGLAGAAGAVGAAGLEQASRQAMAEDTIAGAGLEVIVALAEKALADLAELLARLGPAA